MKYVISGLKGAFIAIVCGVLLTLYFGGEIDFESMTLILVYGFVQGAMSKVIDEYVTIALLEFVSQALASYLLAWGYLLVNTWLFDSSWQHHIWSFYYYLVAHFYFGISLFNRQKSENCQKI